ncbi:STAS domain-containing protein [Streptomyces sp. SDT5-1]|uniref:STAS domain-containing protein n=1 Tax=Streptomyces sp. SDT5-1 TaxID=3406418 RepID=UPI003FD2AD59
MGQARARFPVRWEDGGVLVVQVMGRFDADAATDLGALMARLDATGHSGLVVDFHDTEHCAADAARTFVDAGADMVEGGGALALAADTPVCTVLLTAGAARLPLGVHEDVAAAVEKVAGGPGGTLGDDRDADAGSGSALR